MGTQHSSLYPSLAARTGKEFARYVNDDPSLQQCRRRQTAETLVEDHCESRQVDLQVGSLPVWQTDVAHILHHSRYAHTCRENQMLQ
jgi:hypothetical protein